MCCGTWVACREWAAMYTFKAAALVVVLECSMPRVATAQRLILGGGANLGGNNHPRDHGMKGGVHLGADLRVGWLLLGVTLGRDEYKVLSPGPPISATGVAAHLGGAAPLARRSLADGVRELEAIVAVELGRHAYTARGGTIDLCLALCPDDGGGGTTWGGDSKWVTFVGVRSGVALTTTPRRGIVGTIKFELVARRDRDAVHLLAHPGCDPTDSVGCAGSADKVTAGGDELSLVISLGLSSRAPP
jgi:hypothetical protein